MSEQDALAILETALSDAKAAGATGADIVYMQGADLSVSVRLGQPEEMQRAESAGVGIRVFVGDKYAFSSSTDLSRPALKEAVERCVTMAKASIADPHSRLAEAGEWGAYAGDLELCEEAEPSIEWMREQCHIAEDAARSHAGITNSEGAEMAAANHHILLASSVGKSAGYASSSVSLSACVLGGSGEGMERDYAFSVARFCDDLTAAEAIGNEAAERTLKRLNPDKPATARLPVVFEPRVGKSLLGNFLQSISGSNVARGTSFLAGKMNQQIFAPGIHVLDDPHRRRGLASKPFDGEGLANAPLSLVEDGVLKHWLLDLRSANQLQLRSNARAARGIGSAPSPSATNCHIAAGDQSPQALIGEIEKGVYITNIFGMGVNLVTGEYSQGASGFLIEQGKITSPISEITIAGQLLDMFRSMTPANDLHFDYAANVPTLRIAQMTIAGA